MFSFGIRLEILKSGFLFLISMDNMDMDIDESAISMDFEQLKLEFQ